MEYRQLEPFGVEVLHDLSAPLCDADAAQFVSLLWEHGLVLARGQALSMERQRAICALAGPILLRAGENGIMTNQLGEASATELSWHADAAYTKAPFDALSLHALDVIADASSIRFVHAGRVLETLPSALRESVEGARAEMISPGFDALGGRTCDTRDPQALKRGEMPAIYRNPHSGRNVLWVSELQTARLLGTAWEDSRDLLHAIFDHLYAAEQVFEHRWRNGDFIVWDNIALQHARGSLRDCGRRVLQRVIVGTAGIAPHIQEAA